MKQSELFLLISKAIEELNLQLPVEQRIVLSNDIKLFGYGGVLDSLSLVNLIVIIEEMVESQFGVAISLFNEQGVSNTNGPFQTVQSLSEYLTQIIEAKSNS